MNASATAQAGSCTFSAVMNGVMQLCSISKASTFARYHIAAKQRATV